MDHRLTLSNGMFIVFGGNIYHAGATSECTNKSTRFFTYLVKYNKRAGASYPKGNCFNSSKFSCFSSDMCSDKHYQKYQSGVNLDFSDINVVDYTPGEIIGGGLLKFGWVVVNGFCTLGDHPNPKQ